MLILPFIAEISGGAATSVLPKEISVQHIDASWVSLVVGGVTTGIAVAGLFLIAGWILYKYVGIRIGGPATIVVPQGTGEQQHFLICPENCPACGTEHERSKDNKEKITDLYSKWNNAKDSIAAMATDVAVIKADVGAIKTGIKELQNRRRGSVSDA